MATRSRPFPRKHERHPSDARRDTAAMNERIPAER